MSGRRSQLPQDKRNPYGGYRDDQSVKEVLLQADGKRLPDPGMDRHVCIRWTNAVIEQNGTQVPCTQVVHLTGWSGSYAFHTPQVKLHSEASRMYNTFYSLGHFNRAQRDRIIDLAHGVRFDRNSSVNDCRTWMRDLLEAMVNDGLIHKNLFDHVDSDIPLKRRVPEVESGSSS
ncbi:hypothetical protein V8D89_014900 [Ganoderma adspersum]